MSGLKEACGIAGVILRKSESPNESSYLAYLSLHALQHRGQESAGIISFKGDSSSSIVRNMGLVGQIFDQNKLDSLKGHLSLGHVRYSTTGESEICNAQPIVLQSKIFKTIALAHNGNLVNSSALKKELTSKGTELFTTSDSELLIHLLDNSIDSDTEDVVLSALKDSLSKAKGAFSLGISLGGKYLIGVKDPNGLRPLCLGAIKDDDVISGYIIASESCALDIVGAEFIRELSPGEVILINEDLEIKSTFLSNREQKLCLFEMVYFMRPDSEIRDVQISSYREELGKRLAINSPPPSNADIVIGVPDSGTPAAIGFATQSGLPFTNGLVKNRYIGRTFIQPSQSTRQLGIKIKLNPLPKIIKNKSVVLIDDSVVRGNTPRQLVKLLKQAGAKEVHMRISSPPIAWGCYYGIAMKDNELIARRMKLDIEEIRKELGADSLAYLNLEDLLDITNSDPASFCTACFNGNYPAGISDEENQERLALT
ncbi:MAG: amidophosphoribosyltransferase [Candidatus Caenarcaniphilales bacterium]|nr:amidophosphoribosyltransferase [Candidatus Caenarcaniphilales bacterium]